MKKLISVLLTVAILLSLGLTMAACSSEDGEQVQQPANVKTRVCMVKAYNAGYGVEWLKIAAEKFNSLYEKEGYVIQFNEEDADINLAGDVIGLQIEDIAQNDYDLFFTSGTYIINMIEASQKYMRNGQVLLEDLTEDVYLKPAIKFNGSEENATIESKVYESARKFYTYNDTTNSYFADSVGRYYAFPWASGASGIYANKNLLKEKFNNQAPRTTDELMEQVNSLKAAQEETGIYPVTYAGMNAMGYWLYMYDTLFAQYSGYDKEVEFWNLPTTEDGYRIYNDQGLLEALKVIEVMSNKDNVKNGTNKFNVMQAQGELIQGKALYMVTGNWVYNEMKGANPEDVNNLVMIKMPIISALGTKLGIDDNKLRAIVSDIDNELDIPTVAANNGVSADIATAVYEARHVYYNSSIDHQVLIPSYSDEKDIAKLFLRFLASDEFMALYSQKTNSALPMDYIVPADYEMNDFERSVNAVRKDSKIVVEDRSSSPIRRKAGVQCFGDITTSAVFTSISKGEKTAQEVFESTAELLGKPQNWQAYLSAAR